MKKGLKWILDRPSELKRGDAAEQGVQGSLGRRVLLAIKTKLK